MINNNHHFEQSVFSRQSHTAIEQILPTSGLVASSQRTNGYHPARQTRIIPLNVDRDISRDSARLTADRIGEWSHHPTHTDPCSIWNMGNRPDSVPTHIRLSESNAQRDTHQRQVVTLVSSTPSVKACPARTSRAPTPMRPDRPPAGEERP
jgi:hypothetical protein